VFADFAVAAAASEGEGEDKRWWVASAEVAADYQSTLDSVTILEAFVGPRPGTLKGWCSYWVLSECVHPVDMDFDSCLESARHRRLGHAAVEVLST